MQNAQLMKLKFLITSILLTLSFLSSSRAFGEPCRIGIPLPLTGALAATAQDVRRGFELGKEILGITDMQLIFEDDGCDGSKSVTVVKKLIEIDNVDVISGIVCNTALLPVGRIIDRAKIPTLTVGSFQPIALLAFEALRVINQAHKEGIPLDIFLRRGPIKDGAIKDYSFDEDGAVQGVGFQVIRIESDAQKE